MIRVIRASAWLHQKRGDSDHADTDQRDRQMIRPHGHSDEHGEDHECDVVRVLDNRTEPHDRQRPDQAERPREKSQKKNLPGRLAPGKFEGE